MLLPNLRVDIRKLWNQRMMMFYEFLRPVFKDEVELNTETTLHWPRYVLPPSAFGEQPVVAEWCRDLKDSEDLPAIEPHLLELMRYR